LVDAVILGVTNLSYVSSILTIHKKERSKLLSYIIRIYS